MKSTGIQLFLSVFVVFAFSLSAMAAKKKIMVSCSEPDAAIYANGVKVGSGQAEVLVLSNSCVTINIEKNGFLSIEETICNKKGFPKPPKSKYYQLENDPAFDASLHTDIANTDVEVELNPERENIESWKILNQIITNYFDVIEISDRETGYLRTAWNMQSFESSTVRTRIIVKIGTIEPLSYKVKLVSEIGDPDISVKSDHKFKEWNRILRSYESVIDQIVSRLK